MEISAYPPQRGFFFPSYFTMGFQDMSILAKFPLVTGDRKKSIKGDSKF